MEAISGKCLPQTALLCKMSNHRITHVVPKFNSLGLSSKNVGYRHNVATVRASNVKFSTKSAIPTVIFAASAQGPSSSTKVVVTREKGKNRKLSKKLTGLGMECVELPLIEHAPGADLGSLRGALAGGMWSWVLVTSPEGAKVLRQEWRAVGSPGVLRVGVVGAGTAAELAEEPGLDVEFTPSKATGVTLAKELPFEEGKHRVLYAASAKAGNDVQDGLEARGFEVHRLNTYTTQAVENVDPEAFEEAKTAHVVTFASPSTIKAWIHFMGDDAFKPDSPAIACIGKTSADACEKAGLKNVFHPDKPGIDGWVQSVQDALE